ncbi:FHA domain-containing protein [Vallicoccus soli]|uniref:FHA domain-containing protein n=1 Tax=Vallicoccus soli TaxID=2339232 RepID=A0A3A3ZDL5_9ACTN|nr:FHA domain-containing protein [Vallicoccus soli]RJK93136.1 FHA domain-containing protein [Vallicoccus soli]
MPFCTQCGHANSDDSRFCSNCGAPLRAAAPDATSRIPLQGVEGDTDHGEQAAAGGMSPADQAAVDALPAGSALLVVRRGPNSGSRFLLGEDVTTAGRHPESDIFLDDVTVSRRHAEFTRSGGSFAVRDVGSLNGTYVNRQRIDEVVLAGGDEVQIGKYRLVFFPSQHDGPAAAGRA